MKIFIFLIITLMLSTTCMAKTNTWERIEMFADSINNNMINESVIIKTQVISWWVERTIEYKFYWHPRGVSKTWKTLEGDCTDKAMLKQVMLNHIGIKNRLVHGFDTFGYAHDSIEYYYNKTWNQHEYGFVKRGNHVW